MTGCVLTSSLRWWSHRATKDVGGNSFKTSWIYSENKNASLTNFWRNWHRLCLLILLFFKRNTTVLKGRRTKRVPPSLIFRGILGAVSFSHAALPKLSCWPERDCRGEKYEQTLTSHWVRDCDLSRSYPGVRLRRN